MRARLVLVVALLAAACTHGAPTAAAPGGEPALVVTGATLWDGTGKPPIHDAILVIRAGRIEAVGARGAEGGPAVPAGARTVDASGRWIIPGLVDGHVHFSQSGSLYTRPDALDLRRFRPYADELARTRAGIDDLLRRYLALGITAVVDVGGPMWTFDVRARARNATLSPRVAVAGPLLAANPLPPLDLGDPPVVAVTTPEAARAAVRTILARAPDLVKLLFGDESPAAVAAFLPLAEAIIAAAHARGVRVAAHATRLATARAVVAAGVDVLVHDVVDVPVDDAFVALLREHGVILMATLVVDGGYQRSFAGALAVSARAERFAAPDVIASWRAWPEVAEAATAPMREGARARLAAPSPVPAENLRRLHAGGVILAAGSDAGNIGTLHGLALFDELAAMHAAGLANVDVLLAATRDAARVFARVPDFGTLVPGQRADFLVLDGDPLADLAALERVEWVARDGVLRRPDAILPPR
jgi:imidazolonepropionase-like amidohydrolase